MLNSKSYSSKPLDCHGRSGKTARAMWGSVLHGPPTPCQHRMGSGTTLEQQLTFPNFLTKFVLDNPFLLTYLVDPASSHMLVSKIKPCMSKYN